MNRCFIKFIFVAVGIQIVFVHPAPAAQPAPEETPSPKAAPKAAQEEPPAKNGGAGEAQDTPADAEKGAEKGVVRVPYVPEHIKQEIREQIRQEVIAQAKRERWGDVNALPEWLSRLKWDGDLRLRFLQADRFSDTNAPPFVFQSIGQNISNTTDERERARIRLRLALEAKVTRGVDVGVRITTGNTSDPVSTNQTLGTTANKYAAVWDRAFLLLTPWDWFEMSSGRISNPFLSTDLVWDDDLGFEGTVFKIQPWAKGQHAFKPFLTLGGFPLQEIEESLSVQANDKWLLGAQIGFGLDLGHNRFKPRFKLGAAYYNYTDIEGIRNPTLGSTQFNKTAPDSRQKGNSVFNIDNDGSAATNLYALAADYDVINVTLTADFAASEQIHLTATLDYARNLGFDRAEVLARTGQSIEPEVGAYQARFALGHAAITQPHAWQLYAGYRSLERDAVPDAFTDSDFHLGGTNNQGYIFGGAYGLGKNTWLSLRWLSSDEISGLPLSIDILQIDINVKF